MLGQNSNIYFATIPIVSIVNEIGASNAMSHNFTQPEELNYALMEMTAADMQFDALTNEIRHLNKPCHDVKCVKAADHGCSSYSSVHVKSIQFFLDR